MCRRTTWAAVCLCLSLAISATGGRVFADDAASSETPTLPVSRPIERQVTDFADFTGRTDAVQSVKIIPRVTGYIDKAAFKEGSEVRRGDLLFEIDPRPYQAQLDQAQQQLDLNQARWRRASADFGRAKELAKTTGAISESDLASRQSAEDETTAAVAAAKATVMVCKLNLAFCRVTSPIDGQAGRYLLTPGNLAKKDETELTTVVSLDPMYVYFDIDEVTLLRIRRTWRVSRLKQPEGGRFTILFGLQDESGYPHQGIVTFFNNRVDSATGTLALRATVENPKPHGGDPLMLPGMSARVRMPLGQPHWVLLVVDRAIGTDQGIKYVYVVDASNALEYRRVEIGAIQGDGLRVIDSGLKAGEKILVAGLKKVRPKMKIQPELIPMSALVPTKRPAGGE